MLTKVQNSKPLRQPISNQKFISCEEEALAALRSSSHQGLCHVRCEVREGMGILRGEVPSYYLKQLAQEIVKKVNGVELVINRIAVNAPD